jgi:hypothetical protein
VEEEGEEVRKVERKRKQKRKDDGEEGGLEEGELKGKRAGPTPCTRSNLNPRPSASGVHKELAAASSQSSLRRQPRTHTDQSSGYSSAACNTYSSSSSSAFGNARPNGVPHLLPGPWPGTSHSYSLPVRIQTGCW